MAEDAASLNCPSKLHPASELYLNWKVTQILSLKDLAAGKRKTCYTQCMRAEKQRDSQATHFESFIRTIRRRL